MTKATEDREIKSPMLVRTLLAHQQTVTAARAAFQEDIVEAVRLELGQKVVGWRWEPSEEPGAMPRLLVTVEAEQPPKPPEPPKSPEEGPAQQEATEPVGGEA